MRAFRGSDGETIDRGVVIYFPAPQSYTGEPVVELQGHGGQIVTDLVLRAARAAGARQAEAGEFSRRAFLNDRLDLAQAEAVADLIDAETESAARAAQRSLGGAFSRRVGALEQALVDIRVRVEGALDFSDEDAQWLNADLHAAGSRAQAELAALLKEGSRGRRLIEGYVVAIAGRPNVGKSTLLNRLAGTDAAIVTDIPGTTRDPLREAIDLRGLPVTLVDTAGLRESSDPIESEGVARARRSFERCELILYLADARTGTTAEDEVQLASLPVRVPRLLVLNKTDLVSGAAPHTCANQADTSLGISAARGTGVDRLIDVLLKRAGVEDTTSVFSMRARHYEALKTTRAHLETALDHLQDGGSAELAAEELRLAQTALGEVCGAFGTEQLLARIFAGFCIGK